MLAASRQQGALGSKWRLIAFVVIVIAGSSLGVVLRRCARNAMTTAPNACAHVVS